MEGFDDIDEIREKVKILVEYIDIDSDEVDVSRIENRLDDLEALLGEEMEANFPYTVPEEIELAIIGNVCDEYQDILASEWHKKEPKLKYINEWSHEKAFREYEEYIVSRLAHLIAEEMISEFMRPLLVSKYESVLKTQTGFDDFKAVYDRNKN